MKEANLYINPIFLICWLLNSIFLKKTHVVLYNTNKKQHSSGGRKKSAPTHKRRLINGLTFDKNQWKQQRSQYNFQCQGARWHCWKNYIYRLAAWSHDYCPREEEEGKQEVFQCDGVNQLSPAHYGIFTLFLYHILNITQVNESTGRLQRSEAEKKVCHILKKQYVVKCTSVNCITQSIFPNEICRYIVVSK